MNEGGLSNDGAFNLSRRTGVEVVLEQVAEWADPPTLDGDGACAPWWTTDFNEPVAVAMDVPARCDSRSTLTVVRGEGKAEWRASCPMGDGELPVVTVSAAEILDEERGITLA